MSGYISFNPYTPMLLRQSIDPPVGQRGKLYGGWGGTLIERQRLPEDSIGVTTVIFSGVQPNSEIRVMLADGTELAGVELCTSNHVLTWAGYANGNINNNVVIRIIHPQYKIKEIDYITVVGNITFPIQQDIDKWYINPT